jgi:hypothetical protein
MSKLPYLACAATLLLVGAKPQTEMFSKYKPIEAYEIRPGGLVIPRYAQGTGKFAKSGWRSAVIRPN